MSEGSEDGSEVCWEELTGDWELSFALEDGVPPLHAARENSHTMDNTRDSTFFISTIPFIFY